MVMDHLLKCHKFLLSALFTILCAFCNHAIAAISTMAVAVDVAGSQRMLSQRMFKDYSLVLLNVETSKYQSELTESVNRFDRQLQDLTAFASTEVQQQRFREVREVWVTFRPLITSSPKRADIPEAKRLSDALLRASHAAVQALSSAGSSLAVVDISGRQRMLSQKLANLYMLKALGVEENLYWTELNSATQEFEGALDTLITSGVNTPDISSKLKKVKTQFSLFKFSVTNKSDKTFPFTIADAAEKILNGMNEITYLYTKELEK